MTPSLRSAPWILLAANLLGGSGLAFAQPAAPAPAVPPAPVGPEAGAVPSSAPPAQTPPVALGKRSLIGARCKDDIAKLCASAAPGGGKLAACLRSHEAELSEACKAALPPGRGAAGAGAAAAPAPAATAPATPPSHHGSMMGKEWGPMKGMHKACGADVEKLCKDVAPGHGRVAMCLNAHVNELSPACKPVAENIGAKMNEAMELHADCAADVQKHCPDVQAGSGRVGFCLGEHAAELSAPCKKHVNEMKAHFGKGGKGGMMGGHGGHGAKGKSGTMMAAPPAPVPAPAGK